MPAFLRESGVVVEPSKSDDPLQRRLADHRCSLINERGLVHMTVIRYENLACRFLALHPVDTDAASRWRLFLLEESRRVSVGSAKGRVTDLRSL